MMNIATITDSFCIADFVDNNSNELSVGEMTKKRDKTTACDTELVQLAIDGDLTAFTELVNRYYSRSVRVAFGMLKSRQDAEDIVQDAFVKAHLKLKNFQGQSSFYTWLYRIVINLSIDRLRKRKREKRVDVDDSYAKDCVAAGTNLWPNFESHCPEKQAKRGDLVNMLQVALLSLNEQHRAILLLREVDGLSYDEIADVLNIKKGTVMSRLFHARQAMKKTLIKQNGFNFRDGLGYCDE